MKVFRLEKIMKTLFSRKLNHLALLIKKLNTENLLFISMLMFLLESSEVQNILIKFFSTELEE